MYILRGIFIYGGNFMNSKSKRGLLTLVECSLMIALATVLSVFPIFEMPYGGKRNHKTALDEGEKPSV